MRTEGTLTKWNDDRGFGFITSANRGPEVFVHVSAFPRDGQRPRQGERVTFELESGPDDKQRASRVFCPDRPASRVGRQRAGNGATPGEGWLARITALIICAGLALYGYGEYTRRVSRPSPETTAVEQSAASGFRCDGRTHCSEMTSCAEATYFLKHCPNVKMDGNHDGVPCEQQWCTGPLPR